MSIKIVIDLDDSSIDKLDQKVSKSASKAEKSYSEAERSIEKALSESTKKLANSADKSVNEVSRKVDSFGERVFKLANQVTAVGLGFGKGLLGDIGRISALSVVLDAVADRIARIDNDFARFAANVAKQLSTLAGAFSFFSLSVLGVSAAFVKKQSTNFVRTLQDISKESLKSAQSIDTLDNFIQNYNDVTLGAIGSTASWRGEIESLASELNITQTELNKSAQEIIAVASQYGFAESELQNLVRISAEYAKVNKKEVFPTTLAIVNALTGNSQAAQALGIKLNEASVSAFALKNGLAENFRELDDNQKAQIRYNKLLDQFTNISGIAQNVASGLADQQNALTVATERVSVAFGKGIANIENLQFATAAISSVAASLNETFVEVIGTVTALGARIVQVVSSVVLFTVKVFTVVKVFTILKNIIGGATTAVSLFNAQIPILNISLSQLITRLTAGRASGIGFAAGIDSASASLKRFIVSTNLFSGSGSLIARLFSSIRFAVLGFAGALKTVLIAFAPLLIVFAKLAAAVAIIAGAFSAIRAAIIEVERRTRVFSAAYNALTNEFSRASSFFQPVIDLFARLGEIVSTIAQKAFGLLILAITKTFELIASIVARNPFGVFSDDTVLAFAQIEDTLSGFNNQLIANGFILEKFETGAKRSLASVAEAAKKSSVETAKSIKRSVDSINNILVNGLVQTTSFAIESLGASLRQGSSAFSGFAGSLLSILGDIAIQLGQTLIKIGLAVDALKKSLLTLSGGVAIAAGVGLIALGGFLKSFGPGLSGVGTGGSGAAFGPAEVLTRPNDDILEEQRDEEREKQDARVTVNIQGSVFDTKETGTQIAKILSDSFGSRGVVLTDARFA